MGRVIVVVVVVVVVVVLFVLVGFANQMKKSSTWPHRGMLEESAYEGLLKVKGGLVSKPTPSTFQPAYLKSISPCTVQFPRNPRPLLIFGIWKPPSLHASVATL